MAVKRGLEILSIMTTQCCSVPGKDSTPRPVNHLRMNCVVHRKDTKEQVYGMGKNHNQCKSSNMTFLSGKDSVI